MKLATSLGAALFLASSAALACDYPDRPHIPDGTLASKEELLAARNDVHAFFEGVDEYLRCIEEEAKTDLEAADASQEERQKRNDDLNSAFDAANGEKEMVGELLNKQIRAWNEKRKQDSED
jgi:hypothetical protein